MLVYKNILFILVNFALYFLVKKKFPQLNKTVYCLIIATGIALGSIIDYLLFLNPDNLGSFLWLLIFLGMATFLLATYIFRR